MLPTKIDGIVVKLDSSEQAYVIQISERPAFQLLCREEDLEGITSRMRRLGRPNKRS